MNIPITTSLEWSKKLKERGWPQGDANFQWHENGLSFSRPNAGQEFFPSFAAPTAEEMLRKLPEYMPGTRGLTVSFGSGVWCVQYMGKGTAANLDCWRCDPSLSNAAAAMYCYLAENKLLPTEHAI